MEHSSSTCPITPSVANITSTISTSTISTATTSSATATTTTSSSSSSSTPGPVQLLKIYDFRKDQDYIQILLKDLEKLDPEKNGLQSVTREIISSTLTTRLRGVCKINRLIGHANDICLSFNELGSEKHNEHIERLRDWIMKNKIIEHIFGPNCHVEIIKQSHTILNFVAFSLDNEQVDVIWSASSLKHCGRQVLDLLTSLIRSMRAGPVLHLYWLVRNLNVEEHTEHTLLLTSHILRFIWSHSPCINQIEFCSVQKDQLQQKSLSNEALDCDSDRFYNRQDKVQYQAEQQHVNRVTQKSKSLQNRYWRILQRNNNQSTINHNKRLSQTNQYHRQNSPADDDNDIVEHDHQHIGANEYNVMDKLGCDENGEDEEDDLSNQMERENSPTKIERGEAPEDSISSSGEQDSSHQRKPNTPTVEFARESNDTHFDPTATEEEEWLSQLREDEVDFLDFASDVSVCCSEEKDMADFDDDSRNFFQDENAYADRGNNKGATIGDSMKESKDEPTTTRRTALNAIKAPQNPSNKEFLDSGSTTRDSECGKLTDHNIESLQQASHESIVHFEEVKNASLNMTKITSQICADEDLKRLSEYNLVNLADNGKTLLWDLLQDDKIEHLTFNLHIEVENVLVNLVMSSGDRYIRYRFIEACLENLSKGTSVIISLRLLPRLMSFNTITRSLSLPAVSETYTIVLWAEREHNMSKNFFKYLVEDHNKRKMSFTDCDHQESIKCEESQEIVRKSPFFSQLDAIITRMSFLTFIYSKPFSPVSMRLDKDQMDQLWDCLALDDASRCSDVLFQWIYQQAIGEDFHGVDDELLDYILKYKLPTLPPEQFRLRGLKLLEQLLWIRQDFECCHELKHPATRLLWDIALKARDDEVSLAAIRILNHFYIYNNHQKAITCKQGINFMRYCMDHLQSSLLALKSSEEHIEVNQSLDVMQRVLLLIRTHLEVFRAHWSYYLRTLQSSSEADLTSHRLNAYDLKLTMTIRLVCQAASSTAKTVIEIQASDFVGELRAEIVRWWFSQVDRTFLDSSSANSPSSSRKSPLSLIDRPEQGDSGCEQHLIEKNQEVSNKQLDNFTRHLLDNHHSLRLLSLNQEIPFDWDERQINELDFKDMQIIYVLNDVRRPNISDSADELESNNSETNQERLQQELHFPSIESIPSIVLQKQENFELLMDTDKYLGSFRGENFETATRCKALSRRVWEIIQILPTSSHYRHHLKRCGSEDSDDAEWTLKTPFCAHLMSAECPQRLLYSLQIIDILRSAHDDPCWASTFIRKGGLSDLYDIFMSQKLLPDDSQDWNEWLQECLAYLLKLIFQFGTKLVTSPNPHETSSSSLGGKHPAANNGRSTVLNSVKRMRRNRYRASVIEERMMIPMFSDELLALLESTDLIFDKLMRILKSSALCRNQSDQYYYVTMSSRAMIVHHAMNFLSSWCKSDNKFPKIQIQDHERLLKALILDDTDPSSRREACSGFLKLHYACVTRFLDISLDSSTSTTSSDSSMSESASSNMLSIDQHMCTGIPNMTFSADLLACLVKFLPIAESMKTPRSLRNCLSESEYIKELNSPGCKDYFWLTCRLIDAPNTCFQKNTNSESRNEVEEDRQTPNNDESEETAESSSEQEVSVLRASSPIDLHELCKYLVAAIKRRPVYETRDYSVEDDVLRGMLMMMSMAIRRDPSFRYTQSANAFILELYQYLFAVPTEKCRYLPKCKSGPTRSTAFDLLLGLVEFCPKNYMTLLTQLLQDQHQAILKSNHPNEYWPHDDCRSEVGFVGLINLGATCYLATCMQHLFMIPDLRYAILSIKETKNLRHGDILQELQKIFAFLLESERKAYNPRNFCKVYTMDNHPLNIAEQTDMTEFLTDLITKLEESSPSLRHVIKSLFSGTLSNNVVSLDCPHISRTTEEFYTLRVQVADMRNLNDSLDELTVKDTLEGDNMYTCSSCEKKVRAEKRACIVKLPRILCFNTMRYTFNMATMTKEKVNTHFSFPLKLDMADYLEANLMKRQQSPTNAPRSNSSRYSFSSGSSSPQAEVNNNTNNSSINDSKQDLTSSPELDGEGVKQRKSLESDKEPETLYELIGVTVHTGNADGGHYYCFIRDCEDNTTDKPKWYLFNDAEVKPFDDSHIGTECYGGELTTKSYDAINDRFMDFSIEKTNSAYMLFYKRVDYKFRSKSVAVRYLESDTERYLLKADSDKATTQERERKSSQPMENNPPLYDVIEDKAEQSEVSVCSLDKLIHSSLVNDIEFNKICHKTYNDFELPRHLATWIWNDNLRFSRDQFIFEHNYFDFIWQICANVSRTLATSQRNAVQALYPEIYFQVPEDTITIETVHLSIIFVLGVLMSSRERPNLSNWTELIRKQFNSRAAYNWLMQLADQEDTWLKQLIQRCPIEMVRQLFQRLCNDMTGIGKQQKKMRLVK